MAEFRINSNIKTLNSDWPATFKKGKLISGFVDLPHKYLWISQMLPDIWEDKYTKLSKIQQTKIVVMKI